MSDLEGRVESDLESEESFNYETPPTRRMDIIQNGFKIINTKARSLCPKINSLVDCFEETGADIGTITEMWLSNGETLEEDVQDLFHGTGLGMLCRNRKWRSGLAIRLQLLHF